MGPGRECRGVVGLGNPGPRYERTRHNVGFLVVEELARTLGVGLEPDAIGARRGVGEQPGLDVHLIEPQTFMNRSGEPVRAACGRFGLSPAGLLVVHDDLDLPPGRLRFRRGGGTGGHRGLESIAECLGTSDFARLKIGIGRPAHRDEVVDFVLEPFSATEMDLAGVLSRAAEAALTWAREGIDVAMNRANAAQAPLPAADGADEAGPGPGRGPGTGAGSG